MHHLAAFLLISGAALPDLRLIPGGTGEHVISDRELVERVLAGDRRAAEALVMRHSPAVLGRATRLLGRTADAEDVAQDAFYEALRDLKRLKDFDRFGAWVSQIAVHQVHRRFRRRRLRRALGLEQGGDEGQLAQLAAPHSDPSIRAQLGQIDALLAKQASEDRLAWMLRNVEGLPLADVADQVGCSLATVKRRVDRVQQSIEASLGILIFEGGPS